MHGFRRPLALKLVFGGKIGKDGAILILN